MAENNALYRQPGNTASSLFGVNGDEQWLQDMSATSAQNQKYASNRPQSTPLSPSEEASFRQWIAQKEIPFNPNDPISDYDMRGFYKGLQSGDPDALTAINPNDGRPHFPDKWKTTYHHSFSNQSQYANALAPRWQNDTQAADPRTGDVTWDEQYFGQLVPVQQNALASVGRKP